MPERATTTCIAGDCDESAVVFAHFPTVRGYCPTHGGLLADFLSLIDAPGCVGFDGVRARWDRGADLLRRGRNLLSG
jgi:hypothetical protein